MNKSVIIQGNVRGRLKPRIQFETVITSFLSSFRLFSAFLALPSSQKVPCPYSPSVIYRNGCERAIWWGRSRHSAPARQSFPIASLLTFLLCTLRQYCRPLPFQ
ncbi:adenine specific DNA methylase Mod, partial [Neisseria macacae ATCC 33926]